MIEVGDSALVFRNILEHAVVSDLSISTLSTDPMA